LLGSESKRLIGLDIGSRSVKLVELSGTRPDFELESIAFASVEGDDPVAGYTQAIRSVLETGGVCTRRVATSVCGSHVAVRSFRFPKLSTAELEGAVFYEGSQVIAFDIDDAYVDHTVLTELSEDEEMTEVLFVAVRKENVDARTKLVEESGLEPRIVGVDALVLLEALLLEEGLPETVAVIDIGSRSSSIGVTKRGAAPFVRDIEIAGSSFTEAIASSLGISMAEAESVKLSDSRRLPAIVGAIEDATRRLVSEVRRSLVYYQTREHGSNVDAIFICGGCSQLPGLPESISDATGISVKRWSPLRRVKVSDEKFDRNAVRELEPAMSLAAALAMQRDGN
jgi:type IV pilus assembly protein PilM